MEISEIEKEIWLTIATQEGKVQLYGAIRINIAMSIFSH